jgi:DNA-binding beta-propeller fold protein YncE
VINTATDKVVKTLHVGDTGPGRTPILGNSPNAVTVSPNGQTLYVANAAQNAIAVVAADARGNDDDVQGLIPTGWYPAAVALDAAGQQFFIASGYGFGSIASTPPGQGRSYTDRVGVVSILDVPDRRELARFTKQVDRNNRSLPPDVDEVRNGHDDERPRP